MKRLLLLAGLFAALPSAGQILQSDGFESYALGNLKDNPGWNQFASGTNYLVSNLAASSGAQSVLFDSGLAFFTDNFIFKDISGVAITPGNSIILVDADVMVKSGSSGQASWVGIACYQDIPFDFMVSIAVRPDQGTTPGGVSLFNSALVNNEFPAPVAVPAADTWHHTRLVLNRSNGRAVAYFNGEGLFLDTPIPMVGWNPASSKLTDADLMCLAEGDNIVHWDNLLVRAIQPGAIHGNVQLQDWLGAVGGTPIVIQVRDTNGTVLETLNAVLDADGNFETNTTKRGTLDIVVKASHWLAKKLPNVEMTDFGSYGLAWSLVNGDIDGDNIVSLLDYDKFSTYFDKSSSDSDWNTPDGDGVRPSDTDLDGDQFVSLLDYDLFSDHYDEMGD